MYISYRKIFNHKIMKGLSCKYDFIQQSCCQHHTSISDAWLLLSVLQQTIHSFWGTSRAMDIAFLIRFVAVKTPLRMCRLAPCLWCTLANHHDSSIRYQDPTHTIQGGYKVQKVYNKMIINKTCLTDHCLSPCGLYRMKEIVNFKRTLDRGLHAVIRIQFREKTACLRSAKNFSVSLCVVHLK